MKITIIGAVAGGATAATKARRNDKNAEIVIYEKDRYISYVACGLPYFIGGEIDDITRLIPRNTAFFKQQHDIDIKIRHEVLKINPGTKELTVKNLETGETFTDRYDKLLIATGAHAFMPPVDGINAPHVFSLRNINDALKIKSFIHDKKPRRAIIAGTGFIGLELLENFSALGIAVTMIESKGKITPNLDEDMAVHLESYLLRKGAKIIKNTTITKITTDRVHLSDGDTAATDIAIMATGVRPESALAAEAGVATGVAGGIRVDKNMRTNIPDIYACGDCTETFSSVTGEANYMPLGSTANKTGRIAGDNLTGGNFEYNGTLGTGIVKVFDHTVAGTGMSESEASEKDIPYIVSHDIKPDRPDYAGGREMRIKVIAHKNTGRILGAQIIGYEGVDKRIDIFATLISYKAKAAELPNLDLAYSPPFSTAKDPVHYAGMILENMIKKKSGSES